MLIQSFKAELIKLRRAPIWIAFFAITALSAVMGTFNYVQNPGALKQGWYSLWTQHTLFGSFFFLPALIGVLCAYEWRLEHLGTNQNQFHAMPVPRWMLFGGKLATAVGLNLLAQCAIGVFYIAGGLYAGLSLPVPVELPRWLLMGACAGVSVSAVQLLLSMVMRSFAAPVGLSLMGGVAGLALANMGLGLWFPYSLMAMGMNANGAGELTTGMYAAYFASCAVFTLAPWALAAGRMRRRDVVARG